MAKKDPAFLFYPKDWLEGTAEMHPNEKGVYIDLLCYQHQKGSLPSDEKVLARLVRLSDSEFKNIWKSLSNKFTKNEGRIVNERLSIETKDRSAKAHKNKIIGIFSAFLRTNKLKESDYDFLKKVFKHENFADVDNERLNERINEWCNERILQRSKSIANANADANSIYITKHISEWIEKYSLDQKWLADCGKSLSSPPPTVLRLLADFKTHLGTQKIEEKTEEDFRTHFLNWARIRVNSNQKPNKGSQGHISIMGN
jgi:uncharacterized protein YdaU (DUF1376 family)